MRRRYEGYPGRLFPSKETNSVRFHGCGNPQPFVKDAFHEYVVHSRTEAVNPAQTGTKFAPHYVLEIEPGQSQVVRLRLSAVAGGVDPGRPENNATEKPGAPPPATGRFGA